MTNKVKENKWITSSGIISLTQKQRISKYNVVIREWYNESLAQWFKKSFEFAV